MIFLNYGKQQADPIARKGYIKKEARVTLLLENLPTKKLCWQNI